MILHRRAVLGGRARAASVLNLGDQRGGIQPLMAAAGVLQGAPYTVTWSQFAGAPMLLEALNAGAIDAGSVGDAPFVSAVAAAVLAKAVSVTKADGAVTACVVPHDSPIRTVADLKGKRIATLRGQTGHFLVLAALDRAGLTPGDVKFVFIDPSAAKAALSELHAGQ